MSYAEDMGHDMYDPTDFDEDPYWAEREDANYWVGADGPMAWSEIEEDYLENIIAGLKKGKWESQAHKLRAAEQELAQRRPKRWYE